MKYKILIGFLLCFLSLQAQVRGKVYGSDTLAKNALFGARVELTSKAVQLRTDEDGKFEFVLPKELPDTLIVRAMGYYPDTLILTAEDRFSNFQIILYSEQILPEVVASYKKGSKSISKLRTLLVEELGEDELKKAACCNLSESFETNASVDVSITDAVSGAKQIQMMGLSGIYTQIQRENIPSLGGLESAYGLNSIPGTWVQSIQITKGTGTVVNGYESMAGLINIELKKPDNAERFFVNGYGNQFGRSELNVHTGFGVGKKDKWSTALFAHGSIVPQDVDRNNDGFRDFPNGTNAAFFNRWQYVGEKMEAQFGVNAYAEEKLGGSVGFFNSYNADSTSGFYGVKGKTNHYDFFAKTGFFMPKKIGRSLGILYAAKYHENNSSFGYRHYEGVEKRGYINVIYDDIIGSSLNKIRTGVSGTYVEFDQHIGLVNDNRTEIIPGAYFEYTYSGIRFTQVAGMRYDYHNLFGGIFVPRVHSKYALSEYTDLRFTAGRGWRVPNYMMDYVSLLATSRNWKVPFAPQQEISWNIGGSVVQDFKLFDRKASLVLDYYYTYFENQLIVDRDIDPSSIVFSYSKDLSFSNAVQAELAVSPTKQFDIRLAYKYLDVRAMYNNVLQQKVMVPTHRGFTNFAYQTRNKKWSYDLTVSVFGESRLPSYRDENGVVHNNDRSQTFPLVNGQVTYTYKKFDFYLGGENLFDYRQADPILGVDNPFGSNFDATRVWAPVMGQMIYAGFRFSIEQKEHE